MRPLAVAIWIFGLAPSLLAAQDTGGLRGAVTLGFGAINTSGAAGRSGLLALGDVSAGLSSKTRTQALRFDVDTSTLSGIGTQSDGRLNYTRHSKSSRVHLSVHHRRRPAGASGFEVVAPAMEDLAYVDVSRTDAAQRVSQAALDFRTGIDRPLGVNASLRHRRRTAEDGVGPPRTGRRSNLKVDTRMDLDRRSSVHLRFGYGRFDGDGATQVQERARRIHVGVTHRMNARTELHAWLGRHALRRTSVGRASDRSGMEWRVGVTRKRSNGEIYARLSRDVTGEGGLDKLTFGGRHDGKDLTLAYALGAAKLDGGKGEATLRLSYRQTWPTSSLEVSASRGYFASDLATELRLASRASVKLTHDIGMMGQLDLRLDVIKGAASATLPEQSMRQVRFAYTHRLNKDWGIAGGAQRRVSQEAGAAKATSSGIFLRLERHFAGAL